MEWYRAAFDRYRDVGADREAVETAERLGEPCQRLERPDAATERCAEAIDLAAGLGATERRERLRTLRGELNGV